MPGPVPGIHVFTASQQEKTWMAGTSPAMTNNALTLRHPRLLFGSQQDKLVQRVDGRAKPGHDE